jgi:60 kDa SS-A/Ro ribonucleoprotein
MASCILRKSDDADVILFDTTARPIGLNSRDSVATNTENISKRLGGGTDCSCAMRHLNAQKSTKKLVIFVSDNESWVRGPSYLGQSALKQEWDTYKKRVKDAKLVLIDIQPYSTTQAQTSKDILNVGGFNDSVFEVISRFLESGDGFSSVIDAINV